MMLRYSLLAAVALSAGMAQAQSAQVGPAATQQAREHFQQGLSSAQQGDMAAALKEFETAYAIRPHFSVLYNIGLARATLDHPVGAVAALERYLLDGGAQVNDARRTEVEALIAANRKRIGRLQLSLSAPATRVWIDGNELGEAELNSPIALARGEHTLIYAEHDSPPQSRAFSIASEQTTELLLPRSAPPTLALAQLAVDCDVPGVAVQIAGVPERKTPLSGALLVPVTRLTIKFSRLGYRATTQVVTPQAGELVRVQCEQRVAQPLPAELRARLMVHTSPADAEVLIDGSHFGGEPLPVGIHTLRVERDGFRPEHRLISLTVSNIGSYDIALKPTAATRAREERARARHKTVGLLLGGVGVALLATSAGVYAWNSARYDDWRSTRTTANEAQHAASIQRGDDAALGLLLLGAGFSFAGGWQFFGLE